MAEFLKLKKSNCKNCYKCIRNCPVKSIRFSGNQAHIVGEACVLCGQCFVVCPQNAKEIANDTEKVKVLLSDDRPVVASIAPSFVANYNGIGIAAMERALKQLGFDHAEETAVGATIVKREYERLLREAQPDVLISSCCHSVNLLIRKYYPRVLPYLADVFTPMQSHAVEIRRRIPDAHVVFIGPCVAKKDEAAEGELVDAVLTFEELTEWLKAEGIELGQETDTLEESRSRWFPTTGGILKSMECDQPEYTYMAIDGMENCIAALKDIEQGKLRRCFIEMSACSGSCIGGPVMEKYHRSPVRDYVQVKRYAGPRDFEVEQPTGEAMRRPMLPLTLSSPLPSETEIRDILRQMGKTKPEHELNCGSCGYNTCREKAVAIYQGKADSSMCLPFLKEKAESFSDQIIQNTPNGILVLNDSLEVQQINDAALRIMNLRSASDILGDQVVRILDPGDFLAVRQSGKSIRNRRIYLAEYNKYVEQSILYDTSYHILICLMRDISEEETQREKKEEISRQTVETADKVVEKQMRVVQEIASLLGETAAETKIALTKLKESIADE